MALENAPIQLANLSRQQLQMIADREGIEVRAADSRIEMIQAVADMPRQQLEQVAGDYMYAGRTSLSWFTLNGGDEDRAFSLAQLRKALSAVTGSDPFKGNLKPELGPTPALLSAREWRGKIVLTFAIKGTPRLVFQDFHLREVSEDKSFEAIVRLPAGIVEVRTARDQADQLRQSFVKDVCSHLGTSTGELFVSEAQLVAFKNELAAQMVEYKVRDDSPSPYETHAVSKKQSCPDLSTEPQFQKDFGGMDPVVAELEFDSGDGERVVLSVNPRSHSVYVRTVSSEAALDEIFEAVRKVNTP